MRWFTQWLGRGVRAETQVESHEEASEWPGPRAGSFVVFLDFDGVLHPGQSGTLCYMPALERLVQRFADVDFVVSSTWRVNAGRDYLLDLFPDSVRDRVRGVTPVCGGQHARHAEVINYVSAHGIRQWLAIDDEEQLFPPSCPYLFLVDRIEALGPVNELALVHRLSAEIAARAQ